MNIALLGLTAVSAVASVGCFVGMLKMRKELIKAKSDIDAGMAELDRKKKVVRKAITDLGL